MEVVCAIRNFNLRGTLLSNALGFQRVLMSASNLSCLKIVGEATSSHFLKAKSIFYNRLEIKSPQKCGEFKCKSYQDH